MKIHRITEGPTVEMARSLTRFEREFRYPLGQSESFSISHGDDYPRFFRSMGQASIYLAEISGDIVGSLAVVHRTILSADGSEIPAAYLADAKVAEKFRGGMVLGRLAVAARDGILASGRTAAFSVVMTGSAPSDRYTGRLGIPKFEELGRLAILRFDTSRTLTAIPHFHHQEIDSFHRPRVGDPGAASRIPPIALSVDGASGSLVDTRCGKRLWKSDGSEMMSPHLTELRFTSTSALFRLLNSALDRSRELGFPGLFISLPAGHPSVQCLLDASQGTVELAGASVYGTGLPDGGWMINTSEI